MEGQPAGAGQQPTWGARALAGGQMRSTLCTEPGRGDMESASAHSHTAAAQEAQGLAD